jgi:Ser/Thr protein kinase RdoA (MazF antagonist)
MTWLPGTLLDKSLTEPNLVKMGDLFARLHLHAAAWTPPADFPAGRFTGWLSRDEPDLLFAPEVAGDFTPEARAIITRVRDEVDAAYAALDPADMRVIHCDLWHANIKIHRGQLAAFDFEDTIRGYRLHDIAMALLDLLETVGTARYASLFAAFRRGYEALLPWPEGDLNALQMGRFLWKLNWVARFDRQHLSPFITHAASLFEHALAHGEMPFAGEA